MINPSCSSLVGSNLSLCASVPSSDEAASRVDTGIRISDPLASHVDEVANTSSRLDLVSGTIRHDYTTSFIIGFPMLAEWYPRSRTTRKGTIRSFPWPSHPEFPSRLLQGVLVANSDETAE
jgi:hypothetical protein